VASGSDPDMRARASRLGHTLTRDALVVFTLKG